MYVCHIHYSTFAVKSLISVLGKICYNLRVIITTRQLFTALLFIAIATMSTREISDPDFWWHLRTGQYIVETRAIPHADPFSLTRTGHAWVTHEWLTEVFLYALYALGSFPLLILTFAVLITLAFAFVYARMPGKPYVAGFALLLAALSTAPTWGVRPQMLTLLLASVFLYILEQRRAWLYLLPPLMLLWVNLHSGYALGIVIIATYLVGDTIENLAAHHRSLALSPSRSLALSPTRSLAHSLPALTPHASRTLFLTFAFCLIAVLFNPNGATMYVYPFETLTSRAMQAYIQEWFSPDFHRIEFQPFAWLLIGTLGAMALAGKRVSLPQAILLAGFGYAALRSARHIPIFAIIAAPILADQAWYLIAARVNASRARWTRGMSIVNGLILALAIIVGGARVVLVINNQEAVERARFPAAAVDFLQARDVRGGIYNTYAWGGYLIWRLYPQARVFIDGRADVYGDTFIEEVYLRVYRGSADWRAPLEQYDVRVVLLEPDAPLVAQLERASEWRRIYTDAQAIIFERSASSR